MLHFVYSTLILGMILHHSCVLVFSCFHIEILFEHIFCTFRVFVLGFLVSCLDLKLGLHLSWFVHAIQKKIVLVVFMIMTI